MENQPIDSIETQRPLPNSTGVLVLGILSIVLCCCYGIVGIIMGVISLILANQANKLYAATPELYTEGSIKNMNAGKICAIVGLCLSTLYLIYVIFMITSSVNGELEGVIEEIIRELDKH